MRAALLRRFGERPRAGIVQQAAHVARLGEPAGCGRRDFLEARMQLGAASIERRLERRTLPRGFGRGETGAAEDEIEERLDQCIAREIGDRAQEELGVAADALLEVASLAVEHETGERERAVAETAHSFLRRPLVANLQGTSRADERRIHAQRPFGQIERSALGEIVRLEAAPGAWIRRAGVLIELASCLERQAPAQLAQVGAGTELALARHYEDAG